MFITQLVSYDTVSVLIIILNFFTDLSSAKLQILILLIRFTWPAQVTVLYEYFRVPGRQKKKPTPLLYLPTLISNVLKFQTNSRF